jgi:hypothetical protein
MGVLIMNTNDIESYIDHQLQNNKKIFYMENDELANYIEKFLFKGDK